MKIYEKYYRTIWEKDDDCRTIQIIDQRWLPFELVTEDLTSLEDFVVAIKDMHLRGAPLIGVAAGYAMYLAALEAPRDFRFEDYINISAEKLIATRPTAVNLSWAVKEQLISISHGMSYEDKINNALLTAREIAEEDVRKCKNIGIFGLEIIKKIYEKKKGKPVNILTHCNAGWLATVDYGTAIAPIYSAQENNIPIHVWVDETRPLNQGAKLTNFELAGQDIPHTVIVDNAGGILMQKGLVDLVIVGCDRATINGDAANKIGTYLKALAAADNNIPFYVALPSSTFDWSMEDGVKNIPIEERSSDEVRFIDGLIDGQIRRMMLFPKDNPAANFAFDVTPARLISGFITERGITNANKNSILDLFPEKK